MSTYNDRPRLVRHMRPYHDGELTWQEAVDLALRAGRLFNTKQRVFWSESDGWTWVDAKPTINVSASPLGDMDRHIRLSLQRSLRTYGRSVRWLA